MRRRSSSDESDFSDSQSAEPQPAAHNDKSKTFTSAKYDVSRHSDTLDRRKNEKFLHSPTRSISNGWKSSPSLPEAYNKNKAVLLPEPTKVENMPGRSGWRHLRVKSPWSCSLLTVSSTTLAIALLFFIIHSFATRQLDPKGCQMYYSRPIYTHFADFDTEHTRFASKYSLYLYREGGFDENPKARLLCYVSGPG